MNYENRLSTKITYSWTMKLKLYLLYKYFLQIHQVLQDFHLLAWKISGTYVMVSKQN